jgi:hypothetical protein
MSLVVEVGDPVAVVNGQGAEDGLPAVNLSDRVGPADLLFKGQQVQDLEFGLVEWGNGSGAAQPYGCASSDFPQN